MDAMTTASESRLHGRSSTFLDTRVPARGIATFVVAALGLQQLLLWCFLGLPVWLIVAGAAALVALCAAYHRLPRAARQPVVDLRVLTICFAVSLLVFALGGQGRFFYQTSDWQVRSAVLRDLVIYPWPFAYSVGPQVDILRAPLGFYLLPAAAGKLGGVRFAELAMLVQSATLLTCILALGSCLFETRKKQLVALAIFLGFSGMDVLGMMLVGGPITIHLEWWSTPVQYSSHITQAFWVPMHALAGWTGAVLYLLWLRGRLPLAGFFAALPLLALLSPLAMIGVLPFAAHAGLSTLRSRSLRPADIFLPLGTLLLSVPALLYLASGSSAVGQQVSGLPISLWTLFETLEVIPYLAVALLASGRSRFGRPVALLTAITLLLLPWGQVGTGGDFSSRVSIPALLILAILVAEFMTGERDGRGGTVLRRITLAVLLIGAFTPLGETVRAVARPRPALRTCSYLGVVPGGAPTYVVPLEQLRTPGAGRNPTVVHPKDARSCYELDWLQTERRYIRQSS